MKKLLLSLFILSFSFFTFAQKTNTVKGVVFDKKTNETLIGATVTLKNERKTYKISVSTGFDGSYIFKNVPSGKYEVEAKFISYKDEDKDFEISGGETKIINLKIESKDNALDEVKIAGKSDEGSERKSRQIERKSDQILNAVSAKSIELSPDLTIANVTQRVSGVSIERSNNGEGQYAIIRGMDKRYNYTLVNGVKIPSPDNKNRYVPLDIFPADIVDRMEVYKSLLPSQEGDAIGGGINLVLKDAPDRFTIRANAAAGLAGAFGLNNFTEFDHSQSAKNSPRIANGSNYAAQISDFPNGPLNYTTKKSPVSSVFGLTIGGRSADKKFGVLGALSYQNTYRSTNSIFYDTDVDRSSNEPALKSVQNRRYSTQQERTAVHTKFDYKFNSDNKLDLTASYMNLGQNEFRFASDTTLNLGRIGKGTGRVTNTYRSIRTVQEIYSANLHGEHKFGDQFKMNWSAVYAKATANQPDRTNLTIVTGRTGSLDANGNVINVVQQPALFNSTGSAQSRIWAKNSDEDKAGYLNFIYSPKIAGKKVEFSVGGMYRDKSRDSQYDDYSLTTGNNTTQIYNGDISRNTFAVQSTGGTPGNPLNYSFKEKVAAGYAQFKFDIGDLQTIGGVRYENTDQSWISAVDPNQITGAVGSIKYGDLLPSLNFKYKLKDNQNLRLTYYSAISRPGFYELIPHSELNEEYTETGNPLLKRATADNYDFRYEWFPKELDQLLVGVFYKDIKNPIEYALYNQGTSVFYSANNFGNARNYGFEFDATKYINKFGFRINYTYTNSKITTPKTVLYRDAATTSLTQRTEEQSRPLQGQSNHIGNLSLLFKDIKSGFDAQIAAVYTGARIYTVSPYLNNDIWQKASIQIDLSAEQRIAKRFSVYMKINNLLNTPSELEIRRPYNITPETINQKVDDQEVGKNVFVRKDLYQQFYLLGLRYKL
ncbi:TonB-dependent receptor [Pedobacter nototheniae]|uniref:TonB-dependent receptor n=1 Tax=Pedobacter nototheniae TaxID=2488994 RepID=UPI00103A7773|nr:TonB-dependent receptor [Pedobacter nototheniae]